MDKVPIDVLSEICQYLNDPLSVVSLSMVCHPLYDILSHSELFWKTISFYYIPLIRYLIDYCSLYVRNWKQFFMDYARYSQEKVSVIVRILQDSDIVVLGDKVIQWDQKKLLLGNSTTSLTFDRVFLKSSSQEEIYNYRVGMTLADSLEKNYNMCYMAYGNTGSGKTHSLFGPKYYMRNPETAGIFPRFVNDLFNLLNVGYETVPEVQLSMLQIYNESIRDLIDVQRVGLHIKSYKNLKVRNLSEYTVTSEKDVLEQVELGIANKNALDSRSGGSIMTRAYLITILKVLKDTGEVLKYIFCECAGNEEVRPWEYWYASNIDRSELSLQRVLKSLAEKKEEVPYRKSKVTGFLREYFDPKTTNSKLFFISTGAGNEEQTLTTAHKVKSSL
eukprot:TRINITY_DN9627_c0_g1_i2.p1 TRINITY_DN9627_c0_g1~~TRINITY_DN9627_c0_g1_i2.p1  ORF type:complete len:389 (+),score=62.55 TRINITY_DN9627_c0_g1_i2:44-1210(+)